MFRGRVAHYLILATSLVGIASSASAKSANRIQDVVYGDIAAPDVEDNASYFSNKPIEVPQADKKKADKIRVKTIKSINKILQSQKKGPQKFELLVRLGELHIERHDYIRDLEMAAYAKSYEKWEKSPAEKRGAEPTLSFKTSQSELVKAANSFRKLVNEFPQHTRTDAALFALAKTLQRLERETAENYYKQLIKAHPNSPFVPDATLALGELYFDKHKIPMAIEYYKKTMKFKDHQAYPFAVYKLGWAYYNSKATSDREQDNNYKKSVAAFKLVIKLSENDELLNKRRFNLKKEAIRDLIMVWADAADIKAAEEYFGKIGEKKAFYDTLERLAHIMNDQGKNKQAIDLYSRIINESPTRKGNPSLFKNLNDLFDREFQPNSIVANLEKMKNHFVEDSKWTQTTENSELLADAKTAVQDQMHYYGATYHNRGIKSGRQEELNTAAKIYTMFLKTFPKATAAYDIRYYLADILVDFKKYEDASDHYMIVAKSDKAGKHFKTAAINSVAAMNEQVKLGKYETLPPSGQATRKFKVPADKIKLIKKIDTYVKLLPDSKDGYPMMYTAAEMIFNHGHYDSAIKRFYTIVTAIPETVQAKAAVKTTIDFYASRKEWDNVLTWSKKFSKIKKAFDQELTQHVKSQVKNAMFNQALVFEKDKQYKKSAQAFRQFQNEFPKDGNADRALYNASLSYYKIGQIEDALAMGQQLLKEYPKSSVRADVYADIASTLESTGSFDEAAVTYKTFARNHPSDTRSPRALFNSAILYKGLGDTKMAAALFAEFIRMYPNSEIANDAAYERAVVLEKQQKWDDAAQAYAFYADRYAKNVDHKYYAQAKTAEIETFHTDSKGGASKIGQLISELKKKEAPAAVEARRVVSSTKFRLSEPLFTEFQDAPINNARKIERQVKAKQSKLVRLVKAYNDIIAIGNSEYIVASLYRLGEANEGFANALFKAPGPQGASQSEIERFKTELEKVAFPLRNEGNKLFAEAYENSKSVQTFSEWTRRAYDRMHKIQPQNYNKMNEISAEPKYLGHSLKLDDSLSKIANQ